MLSSPTRRADSRSPTTSKATLRFRDRDLSVELTLEEFAAQRELAAGPALSPLYLRLLWESLNDPQGTGEVAEVARQWRATKTIVVKGAQDAAMQIEAANSSDPADSTTFQHAPIPGAFGNPGPYGFSNVTGKDCRRRFHLESRQSFRCRLRQTKADQTSSSVERLRWRSPRREHAGGLRRCAGRSVYGARGWRLQLPHVQRWRGAPRWQTLARFFGFLSLRIRTGHRQVLARLDGQRDVRTHASDHHHRVWSNARSGGARSAREPSPAGSHSCGSSTSKPIT